MKPGNRIFDVRGANSSEIDSISKDEGNASRVRRPPVKAPFL